MSIFQERSSKCLMLGMIFTILLTVLLECVFFLKETHATEQLLLKHDQAVASALLSQKIAPDIIAQALTGEEISAEGIVLLNKLGIHDTIQSQLLPVFSQYQKSAFLFSALKLLFPSLLLLGIGLWFLKHQEHLYLEALQTVSAYTDGRFDHTLPQSQEGTLYRFFGCVNHMAAALRAGQEAEHNTKDFLKNTISDISHQLKTPLAALSMYNEIILQEPDQVTTVQAFAEKSNLAIERMKALILSLLKIARLDVGSILFRKVSYPISTLLDKALEQLWERAARERKNLLLPTSTEQSSSLFCDPEWTVEALGNILKNALDHTTEGGTIQIQVEQTPLDTRILISDDGTGIPPEDLHHIFKRFYQGKSSSPSQGAGLGLPLAQAIIQGQNGIISVESTPGLGTTFTIVLPSPASLQNCKREFTSL